MNTYPIAALKTSVHAELAQDFVAYVTGEVRQKVLQETGFGRA